MFIYHFNRMIRSRILWIIFAVVIAFAFLSVDSCHRSPTAGSERSSNDAGTIAGEPVPFTEYEFTRQMLANTTANLDPAATETQIWAHIAAMRTAREMGISATRREVADRILATPDFQVAGVFDRTRYEQVVNGIGFSVPSFERMQSEYIVLYKLMSAVTAGSPASQMAVEDELSQYTDTFALRYATVTNAHANEEIEVTDDDLRDYYERNKANFDLPDRVQVRYVSLPATNFLDSVVLDDIDADVQDIYDSDPSRFTRQGTNGVEQLTLDEAREQIVEELKLSEAVVAATTNLVAFMESLGGADAEEFDWRAKARGLEPKDTALFPYDTQYIPGIEYNALEEFRNEAFDLDTERADSLYAIARGKRVVYLMRVLTNDVAHTQPFEVVADTVRPLTVSEKRNALFDADADAALASLRDAMKDSGDFSAACAAIPLEVSTNIAFKASDDSARAFENARAIVPVALRMKAGDISDPIRIPGGAAIVCLDSRTRDDSADSSFELASTRERIASQQSQMSDALFFSEWLVWNLKEKGFTSRMLDNLSVPSDEDDEED